MTKYQKYFQEMFEENKDLFSEFQKTHDLYVLDRDKWQSLFNSQGKTIVNLIRNWERKLCQTSERGMYAKYSANLSDKFWTEVRRHFPKIDFVGVY